jgi:phosphatidylglycerol---prolipoprotein diacylglyceryl transferase
MEKTVNDWLTLYQNIPEKINPNAFSFGFFSVNWYSLMYLAAFITVYLVLKIRIRRKEHDFPIDQETLKQKTLDFLFYAFLGLIIGGRLGYVIFYNFEYYRSHLLEIISPYDFVNHAWTGIYGMSYHGGLIGIVVATLLFIRKNKINFWQWSDFIVPAIPAGYFFGRIGNFLNGELYGRITESFWGMYFFLARDYPPKLRYPSQLLEALGEGIILFVFIWTIRNKSWAKGKLLAIYLISYGLVRFLVEYVREPDEQIGLLFGYVSMGQILCFLMVVTGLILIIWKPRSKML